ncbi:PHD zinc finger-containing protein [Tieghemostelium lacteum]|uniref:PHD zinc finger-containing protein n=1 Tax=Tieghemostelium lacteum TaxID=361077 RepID=A0A151ZGA5_TIELA|nr:PHD zinc finger-containing protein [Tieghemostelium lacteum]|eukprot:KYQ92957.1 PHD zinc finger-containing protein [Tieghemostelium lacteum]
MSSFAVNEMISYIERQPNEPSDLHKEHQIKDYKISVGKDSNCNVKYLTGKITCPRQNASSGNRFPCAEDISKLVKYYHHPSLDITNNKKETIQILKENHYIWPTIRQDCEEKISHCKQCINPVQELQSVTIPIPNVPPTQSSSPPHAANNFIVTPTPTSPTKPLFPIKPSIPIKNEITPDPYNNRYQPYITTRNNQHQLMQSTSYRHNPNDLNPMPHHNYPLYYHPSNHNNNSNGFSGTPQRQVRSQTSTEMPLAYVDDIKRKVKVEVEEKMKEIYTAKTKIHMDKIISLENQNSQLKKNLTVKLELSEYKKISIT